MTVFEHAGRLLVVDCGVLFPEVEQPGHRPDPPRLLLHPGPARRHRGRRLTHGHEDHLGAVPYLLRERADIPVVGSTLHPRPARRQAARAPHQARPATGQGGAGRAVRPVRPRVLRRQPLDPRRARCRHPHAGRHRPAHRRLQDGPAADGRPAHRPRRLRPARPRGHRPAAGRLDERRAAGLRHLRARDRAGHRRRRPHLRRAGHRRLLRQPRAPRAGGHRRAPSATGAMSCSSAGRWSATWGSPPTSATCASRRA